MTVAHPGNRHAGGGGVWVGFLAWSKMGRGHAFAFPVRQRS
jgi:hypothetical protein